MLCYNVAKAPRAELKHYDADHFTVYHPPVVDQVVADQIRFLSTHLKPSRTKTLSAPPAAKELP